MNFNKYLPFLLLLALTILIWPAGVFAQCENDELAPTAVCHANLSVQGSMGAGTVLWAQDLNAGSNDDCTEMENLDFRIELPETLDDTPPATTSIELPTELGTYYAILWVGDEAGNWGRCFAEIRITDIACADDTEAPLAVCTNTEVYLSASPPQARVTAASLGLNSTDNCDANLSFLASTAGASATPIGLNNQLFTAPGTYQLDIWVLDDNGNFSSCVSEVVIHEYSAPNCDNDTTAPVSICIDGLTVDVNSTLIDASNIDGGSYDECAGQNNLMYRVELLEGSTGEVPQTTSIELPTIVGEYAVLLWVGDEAGNWSFCISAISVDDICANDTTAPLAVCNANITVAAHPTNGVTIWPQDVDEGSYDDCSSITFDLNTAINYENVVLNGTSITFPPVIAEYHVILNIADQNGNTGVCWSSIRVNGFLTAFDGHVFIDDNENCEMDEAEENSGFQGWTIKATNLETGIIKEVFTDEDGYYQLGLVTETADDVKLEVIIPQGLNTNCNTSVLITGTEGELTQNFAIRSVTDCSYLSVDVSTLFLRRCFDNVYTVSYSNYSNFDVENTTIALALDPAMTMIEASLPYTEQADGRFLFELGTLAANSGGRFHITVNLSCDTDLGTTHCVEAQILPFDCIAGSYAELKVEGECDESLNQVRFRITNIGTAPTTQSLNAIVVEDVLMYMQGEQIDLDAGESKEFSFSANGATWRYEVGQDTSFPYGGVAASFVEGCGGLTPYIATQFSLTSTRPNLSRDCQENVGSWDPNDKQAFPKGVGSTHRIEANTPIEYLVRFQNTGTDTAFTVVIEDQLSEWLNPATLRPGASSHLYRLEQKEDGLLLFHFDNIMLPDSNVNQAASNGFVKFYINQVLDTPLGTTIDNTASIYFDFNEAIVTNTVRHIIGENVITVATQEAFIKGVNVEVYPNPLQTEGLLVLNNYSCQKGNLQLFDITGRLVKEEVFIGHQVSLNRKDFMTSGLYFFKITDQGQLITQGKLIVN